MSGFKADIRAEFCIVIRVAGSKSERIAIVDTPIASHQGRPVMSCTVCRRVMAGWSSVSDHGATASTAMASAEVATSVRVGAASEAAVIASELFAESVISGVEVRVSGGFVGGSIGGIPRPFEAPGLSTFRAGVDEKNRVAAGR